MRGSPVCVERVIISVKRGIEIKQDKKKSNVDNGFVLVLSLLVERKGGGRGQRR